MKVTVASWQSMIPFRKGITISSAPDLPGTGSAWRSLFWHLQELNIKKAIKINSISFIVVNIIFQRSISYRRGFFYHVKNEIRLNKEINTSLDKRKLDWWVESGGPPKTNGGWIMNQRDLNGARNQLDLGDGDPLDAT